ncbi:MULTISPECIES: O-antigen polymerase [Lacticaseibacillus]|jgi:oligosaccharide repeat unit polymerase|uniref:O-antigen ligase n=1 Tax=Lacticaseibacillus huelsenbergensis TaxID=3035291 RepID=A0ABY8DR29_9LACO|nr:MULTISPECIES: O-antigen polymerase [Lacticaseibacillus]WFB39436.1 O-antigen ligase [Lacticaseibacillus huelsenbergensis]
MLPLAFTLILILIAAYFLNNRELMSPAVLYSGAFAFSGLWALAYAGKWFLEPSSLTVLVLVGGGLEFIFVTWFIHLFFSSIRSKQVVNEHDLTRAVDNQKLNVGKEKIEEWTVATWKLVLILVVLIVGIFYTIYEIKKIGGGMSLGDAIYYVRVQTIFTINGNTLPRSVSIIRNFSLSCGFFFGYLLVREFVYFHKFSLSNVFIVLLAIVTTLLMGDRTEMVVVLIAIFCYYYCLLRTKSNWSKPNNKKFIAGIVIVGTIVLLVFPPIANMLGRESDAGSNSLDYLSVYIGAEIKNLDIFLRTTTIPVTGSVWGSQTFVNILPWFAKIFNFTLPPEGLTLPYQTVNGVYLGNVYTTYYAYLYDFGIWGVFTLVPIMAGISQLFFERIRVTKNPNHVPYSILIYSNIVSSLVLSFFSNKFFEQIFARQFVLIIFFWVFLNFFIFETGLRQSRGK